MFDTVIVEVANSGHSGGGRGVGEVPIVPPMSAFGNGPGHGSSDAQAPIKVLEDI